MELVDRSSIKSRKKYYEILYCNPGSDLVQHIDTVRADSIKEALRKIPKGTPHRERYTATEKRD